MDTATATWKETTKSLVDQLAKERKITPDEALVLYRFLGIGQRMLDAKVENAKIRIAS